MLDDGYFRNQWDIVIATKTCGQQSPAKLQPAQAASTSKEPAQPDPVPVEAASAMPNVAPESTHNAEAKPEAEVAAPQAFRSLQRVRYSPLWLKGYVHGWGTVWGSGLNSSWLSNKFSLILKYSCYSVLSYHVLSAFSEGKEMSRPYNMYSYTYYCFNSMTYHSYLIPAHQHAITCLSALTTVYKQLSRVASALQCFCSLFRAFFKKTLIHVARPSTSTLHANSSLRSIFTLGIECAEKQWAEMRWATKWYTCTTVLCTIQNVRLHLRLFIGAAWKVWRGASL